MKILILGSGGREHALAWKIAQSPLVDEVFSAPGNPGMDKIGPCFDLDITDLKAVQELALQLNPDLIIIGPEAPLAAGASDALRARGFDVFGPSQQAARLESSKGFAKDLMQKYGVPTARYGRFDDLTEALDFLETMEAPYVIKADGLAAGKGVVIAETLEDAENTVEEFMTGKFGEASSEIVIEEFMKGEEASVFVMTDGEGAIYLPVAQDHKRVGDGDTGPNTGGMGAYAPAPVVDARTLELVQTMIVEPMLSGMAEDGMPYQGVLYVGIMVTEAGPKVVEFNARFGDPECQVLMAGLPGDIVPALLVCATGGLAGAHAQLCEMMGLSDFRPSAVVVMAANGYPGTVEKGSVIEGVEAADAIDGVTVFHAGTDVNADKKLIAAGGRVLGVTATAEDLRTAIAKAYEGVDAIDWPGGFCRRDIGRRVL
ncbi:phosphoribosylamine--glycine ligase [Henriciella mobilis]|uniref:phosphoribosylamine--glycine ligase n=1 Tax=Henriciella mobilis TaxID=2305467 RepID=UPI000E66E4B1|nr:phosphoribosylamine--glycine ligase [Henriciella mobilis]RIJ15527.1 phosphoribosylamine--glycine ligase [Henriciella mobilis]RIJ18991.1 phosphoribosylamine--glycine ligase [Henriciella mobilis]